jgi:GNAT superfamily N-acetyltransferase
MTQTGSRHAKNNQERIARSNDMPACTPVAIRRAEDADVETIVSLVQDVFAEKYGHLFSGMIPAPADTAAWTKGWVAEIDGRIMGVGLAMSDWVTDVWLKPQFRGLGAGAALLNLLETQIAQDGHTTARLRVVGENEAAIRFYSSHGWHVSTRYPHERWGFEMVNMVKHFPQQG